MRTVEKIAKLEFCSLAKLFISSVMLCHTKTNRGSGSHRVKNLDTENCSTFQKMMQNFAFLILHAKQRRLQQCHLPKKCWKIQVESFWCHWCHVWNMFIHLLTWPLPKENLKNANLVKNYISPLPFPPLHLTGSCKKYECCQNTFNLANWPWNRKATFGLLWPITPFNNGKH